MKIPRKIMACAALVGLSIVGGYLVGQHFIERYASTAVLAAELEIAEYRRLYELVSDPNRIRTYVGSAESNAPAPARELLIQLTTHHDPLKKVLTPVYRNTRADARDLGDLRDASKTSVIAPVMGLRLNLSADQPDMADTSTHLLADLIRDASLNDALTQLIFTKSSFVEDRTLRTEAEVAKAQFEIEQARQKISELMRLATTYAQVTGSYTRQVFSQDDNGGRFLPPAVQIVAEESRTIDLKSQEHRLLRTQRQLEAERALLTQLRAIDRSALNGRALAQHFKETVHLVLDTLVAKDEAIRETRAIYLADIESIRARWIDQARFIAGPTRPQNTVGINRLHTAILAGLLSLSLILSFFFSPTVRRAMAQLRVMFGLGSNPRP